MLSANKVNVIKPFVVQELEGCPTPKGYELAVRNKWAASQEADSRVSSLSVQGVSSALADDFSQKKVSVKNCDSGSSGMGDS